MDVGVIAADVKLDLGHGHIHEYTVKHLAERGAGEKLCQTFVYIVAGLFVRRGAKRIHSPSTALLDLGHVQLEEAVQPIEELLSVVRG